MGKKGESKQLKRFPSPNFWPIHVKEDKWTVKPRAGPHPGGSCLPLVMIVRDVLGYAKNAKEAKAIILEGQVKIDGKIRRDYRYPVGLMDVVELPNLEKAYRALPVPGRGLSVIEIPKEEASYKICRINRKTIVKGGLLHLNLHDGSTILLNGDKSSETSGEEYRVWDTLKLSLPDRNLISHLKLEEGSYVIVALGANQGMVGVVKSLLKGTATRPPLVSIETSEKDTLQTVIEYAFTIGKDKPELTLIMHSPVEPMKGT